MIYVNNLLFCCLLWIGIYCYNYEKEIGFVDIDWFHYDYDCLKRMANEGINKLSALIR